jgi:hypothetical protein
MIFKPQIETKLYFDFSNKEENKLSTAPLKKSHPIIFIITLRSLKLNK